MEKFIKFLEDNNAWENFERAFNEQGRHPKKYKEYCKVFKFYEFSGAFDWSDTREGYLYWDDLNWKWRNEHTSLKDILLSDD